MKVSFLLLSFLLGLAWVSKFYDSPKLINIKTFIILQMQNGRGLPILAKRGRWRRRRQLVLSPPADREAERSVDEPPKIMNHVYYYNIKDERDDSKSGKWLQHYYHCCGGSPNVNTV